MTQIYGVDISEAQGTYDVAKLAPKVSFVIVRACNGTLLDKQFNRSWSALRGVPRGAYQAWYPGVEVESPLMQAHSFITSLGNDHGELPPSIDLEYPSVKWSTQWRDSLLKSLEEFERLEGRTPMIYTGNWYARDWMGVIPELARYPLWLAAPYAPVDIIIPKPWTRMTICQYSTTGVGADYGVDPAANPSIDLDSMDDVDLQALTGKSIASVSIDYGGVSHSAPLPVVISGSTKVKINGVDAVLPLTVEESIPIVVTPPAHPDPTLTATPASITAGDATVIAWGAPGASLVKLGSTVVALSGSQSFRPGATTYFLLHVSYPDGSTAEARADVTVTAAPVVVPPVVVVTPTHRPPMGISIIGGNDQVIQYWIDAGCKTFHIVFNPDAAAQLKRTHPEFTVSHRALFDGGRPPTDDEFINKHGYALSTPDLECYGLNENNHGFGDGGQDGSQPDDIRKRAEFDGGKWELCKARGAKYVGGGYAVGTPNIVVAGIRAAMKQYYAPLFNAGMPFNQHLYTGDDHSGIPIKTSIYSTISTDITWDGITAKVNQTWWCPERTRFYVEWCGFDCSKGSFRCDETGIDGPGPSTDYGMTPAEFAAWAVKFQQLHTQPMPDGKPYQLKSAKLFADGDYNRWGSFAQALRSASAEFKKAGIW